MEVSVHEFGRIPIHQPLLEEQRRIVETLDTVEETIQAAARVIAKHKQVRSSPAADLFTAKNLTR